jgi:hypothetical protein
LKAKPLDYECGGPWTNEGTPFEEPELATDPDCLIHHCSGSQHQCDEKARDVRSVQTEGTETSWPSLRTRMISLLLHFGWIR